MVAAAIMVLECTVISLIVFAIVNNDIKKNI